MRMSIITTTLALLSTGCSGKAGESLLPQEVNTTSNVTFSRDDFAVKIPVMSDNNSFVIQIECYSLNDDRREKFALSYGTDPVADLSCYAKDLKRPNEITMLGLAGESLQFTPAFFWFADIKKCAPQSFHLDTWLRGVKLSFRFSDIEPVSKSAKMQTRVSQMRSATNDRLTIENFKAYCK